MASGLPPLLWLNRSRWSHQYDGEVL